VQIVMAGQHLQPEIFWNGDILPDELQSSVSTDGQDTHHHLGSRERDADARRRRDRAYLDHRARPQATAFAVKIDH